MAPQRDQFFQVLFGMPKALFSAVLGKYAQSLDLLAKAQASQELFALLRDGDDHREMVLEVLFSSPSRTPNVEARHPDPSARHYVPSNQPFHTASEALRSGYKCAPRNVAPATDKALQEKLAKTVSSLSFTVSLGVIDTDDESGGPGCIHELSHTPPQVCEMTGSDTSYTACTAVLTLTEKDDPESLMGKMRRRIFRGATKCDRFFSNCVRQWRMYLSGNPVDQSLFFFAVETDGDLHEIPALLDPGWAMGVVQALQPTPYTNMAGSATLLTNATRVKSLKRVESRKSRGAPASKRKATAEVKPAFSHLCSAIAALPHMVDRLSPLEALDTLVNTPLDVLNAAAVTKRQTPLPAGDDEKREAVAKMVDTLTSEYPVTQSETLPKDRPDTLPIDQLFFPPFAVHYGSTIGETNENPVVTPDDLMFVTMTLPNMQLSVTDSTNHRKGAFKICIPARVITSSCGKPEKVALVYSHSGGSICPDLFMQAYTELVLNAFRSTFQQKLKNSQEKSMASISTAVKNMKFTYLLTVHGDFSKTYGGESMCVQYPFVQSTSKKNNNETYQSKQPSNHNKICQALSHASYTLSNTEYLLCDLQGDTTTLFDPAFNSHAQRCGPTDQGTEGIANFFDRHKCNEICKVMELESFTENDIKEHADAVVNK
eukprot:Nk52_evm5s2011 gene=Nk52_evmTU5s2011